MTKQQLIHNSWSDLGIILLSSQYDFDGWIDVNELEKNQITSNLEYKKYSEPDNDFETVLARPKALKGLENNNGWITIEKESDFDFRQWKVNGGDFWFIFKFNTTIQMSRYFKDHTLQWMIDNLAYYQPIIKPDLPLNLKPKLP